MAEDITVIIADDHPIVRQGLRQTIEGDERLRVVAEAGDGQAALDAIEQFRPQIAVLDIDMPLLDGFAVASAMKEKNPETEIIFLTMHNDEDMFNEAIDLGAKGYVLKDSALKDIVSCIKTVASGQHYTSPSLTSYLINRGRRVTELTEDKSGIKDLTPTELRILKMIAENKTTKEIAGELYISHRTVETHRSNICQKLNIQGTNALLKFALTHKSELR